MNFEWFAIIGWYGGRYKSTQTLGIVVIFVYIDYISDDGDRKELVADIAAVGVAWSARKIYASFLNT